MNEVSAGLHPVGDLAEEAEKADTSQFKEPATMSPRPIPGSSPSLHGPRFDLFEDCLDTLSMPDQFLQRVTIGAKSILLPYARSHRRRPSGVFSFFEQDPQLSRDGCSLTRQFTYRLTRNR